jgi:hypothetical protein
MRRIVTAISAAALALSMVAQAVPAAAVTGYDSAYSGESAFLTLNPGQSGTFTVFFANTSQNTTWTKGTATQVDLAACLEDKVTCDQQDASEAPYNSGWLSATRYATTTQTSVAPGQIGTFTYNVAVPATGSGLHRFNGDLVVSSLGAAGRIHPEGYYQDVSVPGAPVTGAGITVTPSTKATNTVSTAVGTVNGARGIRTYTVTLGTDVTAPVRIALFQTESVTVNSDGTFSFTDADGNMKADQGGATRWLQGTAGTAGGSSTSVQASIDTINGIATGGGTSFEASPPSGSTTITFSVNSLETDQIIPVVWKDANGDGQLDVNTPACCGADQTNVAARATTGAGAPTEKVAVGGQKNWAPENAPFGTYSCTVLTEGDGRVIFSDKTEKYAVARFNGILRRFNWDTNDTFNYVNTATAATAGPGLTQAQFESYLSPTAESSTSVSTATAGEDRLQIAYNSDPLAASNFTFCADRPTRPASITAAITDAPDAIPATQNECPTTPCAAGTDTDTDSDDASITFPISVNPCVASYTVERRTSTDNGISFTTTETVTVNGRIKNSGDTTVTVYDLNVPVGLHLWRVRANANDPNTTTDIVGGGGANDPECGINADNSSNRTGSNATVTTQPGGGGAVSGRPISLDTRMNTNAGLSNTLDTGDIFKVAFNETMSSNTTTGGTIWVKDSDGTVGTITCQLAAAATPAGTAQAWNYSAACDWNAASEPLGGTSYPAQSVLTVQITSTAGPTTSTSAGAPVGTTPGVQIPATIFDSSGIQDTTGDTWDISKSPDVVIDNE